LAEFWPLR